MKEEIQEITIPDGAEIIKHNFCTYDPDVEYSEEKNLFYLWEDLLQIQFESKNLIVDLGWYGDIAENKGCFKIYVIANQNWDNPIRIEISKSQKVITQKLEEILSEIASNRLS